MKKSSESKPNKVGEKKSLQLIQGLSKSTLGIIAALLILFALVMLVLFQTEISERFNSINSDQTSEIPEGPISIGILEIADGKDVETGLLAGEGLELVKANCTACHSSALILQNRFSRETWKSKIEWMQETQGLWDLGNTEPIILDYLAANYAPEEFRGRRKPLENIEWYTLED
ncbi:cytochrome C [Algoriphagus sp.]|uniref:cytochrome C n=1 Tax=Algoriphagus sp. TaxID=1872435 RepID=UPI0025FBE542|nr:cytochrome C [Algoriphagus sp.]